MDLIVREYTDDDFDDVYRIVYESLNYKKNNIKNSKAHEFVGVYDAKVVGYFILNEMIDIIRNLKIYHIDYVCVDKKYRGNGFGKAMMEWAIKYAKDAGACRIELTSGNQRIIAHNMYLSLGFIKRDSSIFRKVIE